MKISLNHFSLQAALEQHFAVFKAITNTFVKKKNKAVHTRTTNERQKKINQNIAVIISTSFKSTIITSQFIEKMSVSPAPGKFAFVLHL